MLRGLQLLGLLGTGAAVLGLWNAAVVLRSSERPLSARLWSVLLACAMVAVVWLLFSLRLITASVNY